MKRASINKIAIFIISLFSVSSVCAETYTSQGNGNWNATSNWKNGSGNSPSAADLVSGSHSFVVAAGHTIVINDSANVSAFTVNGNLVFGAVAGESKTMIVSGGFTVGTGGNVSVADLEGTHILKVSGGFVNNGTIAFRRNSIKVLNVVFSGTQTISGSGSGAFNNFEVASGTVTTNVNLDIDGSFTLDAGAKFNAGNTTINIAGNFTKNATGADDFNRGTSTIVLDGTTVQTISGVNNGNRFHNLTISGGGFVVISSQIDVANDFWITNNSTVSSSVELHFYGNFTVDMGSTYDTNTSYTCFWAGYTGNSRPTSASAGDQIITINGNATFAGISCRCSAAVGTKTFHGSINSTAELRAWGKAQIVDDASTYIHTFSGAIAQGGINLQSPMRITGGTIRCNDATPDESDYTLGSGKITIAGGVGIRSGGTLNVSSDVEIESGYIVLNGSYKVSGSDTTWYAAQIKGNGSNTLIVNNGTTLYMRGKDNFPSNITVDFGETSTAYYDAEFDQTVHATDYGSLYLQYGNKTFSGNTNIAQHLYVYPATNGRVHAKLGNYTHKIGYHIYDDPNKKGVTNITSTGTVIMQCSGNRTQYIYKRGNGTYTFNNLKFVSNDPTYAQTKYITGNIQVNGELSLTNGSTNELLYLALDIDDYEITGSGLAGNDFVLGNNTRIKASGAENFKNLIESFASGNGGTINMHENSVVQFDATAVDQIIPGTTYGNIYLYGSTKKKLAEGSTLVIKGWINTNGYTPKFTVTDAPRIIIEGDWKLGTSYVDINPNATVIFDGAGDQEIVATTLPNVEMRGSQIKTLKGTLTVNGNLSVYSGSEFNADNRSIVLLGNFTNTDAGGGNFHQNAGTLYLRGLDNTQTINVSNANNNQFYDIYIQKNQNDTCKFASDIKVGRNLMTANKKGHLNIENHTITIGGDLYMYQNCNLIHTDGALLHFSSSETEQLIRNYNTEIIYPTMRFTGSAVKRPYDNTFDIDGDVIIDEDAIVSSGYKFQVSGNWSNAGTFNHSSEVVFYGDDQNISGSAFYNVHFSGTGTKKLGGNIDVSGWLKIDSLATLDVSPDDGLSSYDIKLGSHWYNNIWNEDSTRTGVFIPRKGTVTLVGNSSNIYSGDSLNTKGEGINGKSFYNLVINCSDPTSYKRMYPYSSATANLKAGVNDLYVQNNLTINSGIFYLYWNVMYVGGSLQNLGGTFSMNSHYSKYNKLYLGGKEGREYIFDPGASKTIRQIEICGGGKYILQNDYTQEGSNVDTLLHIRKGELHFNHHTITMNSSVGNVYINTEGTMTLDSASVLGMYNVKHLTNLGRLNLIGHANSPAKIQPAASGHYYFIVQKSGTIAANNYCIEGTRGRGLEIRGGTIDATNHLQNGEFSNSGVNWNSTDNTFYGVSETEKTALLTLNGIDLGSGLTIDNVVFNVRETLPKSNVQRLSGVGVVTFTNYSGTLSGATYENDGGDLIDWEALDGFVWTGEGGDNLWRTKENWAGNKVPTATDDVILDHSWIASNYTIRVDSQAFVNNLTINDKVKILINGSDGQAAYGLKVNGKLNMMTGSVIEQTLERDSLVLCGAWTSAGTYTPNGVPTIFASADGTHQLTFPSTQKLAAMIVRGPGALSILGIICVKDSVVLEGGTLIGNNATIKLEGDWIPGSGTFDVSESVVNFCGADAEKEQNVKGGRFWSITFEGASQKNIVENISVNRTLRISKASGTVNAATHNIYMSGGTTYWYNLANKDVFDQTGGGSVVFSGGYSYIGSTSAGYGSTVFNNILIQGSGSKTFYDTAFIKGSIEMVSGANLVMHREGAIDGMNVGTMQINGGGYYIYGEDNFAHNMANIDLSAGTVYYRDSIDQYIYPTQYSSLTLYNEYKLTSSGNLSKRVTRKTLQDDIVVTGTLSISDSLALLDVDNHTITLTGSLSLAANGKQVIWGDNGTLIHVGGSWSVSSNITDFCNVYKRGTGYLKANNKWNVTGDMVFADETHFYMDVNTITGKADKTFTLGESSQLHSSVPIDSGYAFPQGFGSYILPESSIMYLEGSSNQKLYPDVEYGRVYFNGAAARTVELAGTTKVRNNLYVNNDAITFIDNGYDLYLEGATNDLRNYTATSTIYLDGNQDQKVNAGGTFTNLYLNNLNLSGSGIKEIDETNVHISGDIDVATGTTFNCNDPVHFSGDKITNAGVFNHYGSVFTFTGAKEQTIKMGENNKFYGLVIDDDNKVTIDGYGITVGNNEFTLGDNSVLDMGAYTHYIASTQIDKSATSTWITENSNFIFNRSGAQYLPELKCKNIQFSTSGTKYLRGDLRAQNVVIDESIGFSVGSSSADAYTVYVSGSWLNSGIFTSQLDTVFFDSPIVDNSKVIKSNESWFNAVVFNNYDKSASTYKLQDRMLLKEGMIIGANAMVHLNSNNMVVGNDDANSTIAPFRPDGEYIDVLADGHLYIDGGAALQFDHNDDNTHLNVWGTLSMIGTPTANAVIGRSSGTDYVGTEVDIKAGGKVAAKYYQVQYLAPTGFVINNGATIDDENNLSNGIWSNMYTGASYTSIIDKETVINKFIYLTINVDNVANEIQNLSFIHGGSPVIGTHFNMERDTLLANSITLGGTINGTMGYQSYERYCFRDTDTKHTTPITHKIIWPPLTQIVWTGAVSSDWFVAGNWLPKQVPTEDISVLIPLTANSPIIYRDNAVCKNLTITNGALTIEDDVTPLVVKGSVDVQDGGVLSVENTGAIDVYGDWSIATKGYFVPQNGMVKFLAAGGSVSIVPRKSDFNNVEFGGGATYMITGSTINFKGNFAITNGLVWPSSSSYTYNIYGNYSISYEGSFNQSITGFVKFVGTDQSITNGQFNRVRFSNSGEKTLNGSFSATYNNSTRTNRTIIVEDNATLVATCALTIRGNVLIDENAKFDDGGKTHTFTGYYWEDAGTHLGNGMVDFIGNHAQYIYGGSFHNLHMEKSTKYISGDVTLTGDLSMDACSLDMLINNITGPNMGTEGTFTMGEKTYIYARGADNYPRFGYYNVSPTSYSYYSGAIDQTIREANYGFLYLNSNTKKTLEGDINVTKNLVFNENGGTLDANNKNIFLGGYWYNQYNGTFIPRTGRVIFNGTGTQYIYIGVSVENPFYDVEVNKTVGQTLTPSGTNLDIRNTLTVVSGKMSCPAGYKVFVGGDIQVSTDGTIANSGCYELNRESGECTITTNGSILNDLIINGGATCRFKLADDLSAYGNFTLQSGIFTQNGHTAKLGNSLDNIIIYGTYMVTEGGILRIGDASTLVVKSGGRFEVVGSAAKYAQVTNNTGRYYFTVENGGTIAAQYYNFSYLAKQGLILSAGSAVDDVDNFSNGIFSNVVSAGVCVDFRNNQEFVGTGSGCRIENVSFPNNPGGGAVNFKKTDSNSGKIEVYNATGMLAGALYENDPGSLIDWLGDVEYIWTAGSNSTDWWDEGNWMAKLNGEVVPHTIPTISNNVTIPANPSSGNHSYPIINRDSAFAKKLTLERGAFLEINISSEKSDSLGRSLIVASDFENSGTLTMNTTVDTIDVYGNWATSQYGKLVAGNGTVVMSGVGVKTINNRTHNFNNLIIDNNGSIQLQATTTVGGNFSIEQGVFDLASSSYKLTVGGDFVNNGTFLPQSSTLYLNGVGSHIFNPGSSTYDNITISGTGSYTLTTNPLTITHTLDIASGALNVVANTINFGDGSGVDNLEIAGTLNMGINGKLKMAGTATINVNNGGKISLIGTENNEAIVTSQTITNTYAFNINNGGTIAASHYKIERINADGLHLKSGSTIDATYNMSDGQYISGVAGGRYIWFENNLASAESEIVISNLSFNSGPKYNAKRDESTTIGIINLQDALGVVASYYFEDDDKNPNAGAIHWSYTTDVLYWVGGDNTTPEDPLGNLWNNPKNWDDMKGGNGVPSATTRIFIPDVSSGSNIYPILKNDKNGTGNDGAANGIDIFAGASLTLADGKNLTIENALSIADGATLTASDGISLSTINISGQFANNGTFIHGGSSTIEWASALSYNIEMNGYPFYNFKVTNANNATVTFSVKSGEALVVENNFEIAGGTVDCNGGTLEVGGNFTNSGGTFLHGNGVVRLNGSSAQTITSTQGELKFYNLEFIGTGAKNIDTDIRVNKAITIGTTVNAPTADIYCLGDWKCPTGGNYKNNFHGGTGKVKFCGTIRQSIGVAETFTNLEFDNTAVIPAFTTNYALTISGQLKLTNGILQGGTQPIQLGTEASLVGGSATSYINGTMAKNGSGDFFFPIGGSDRYAPIEISDLASTGNYAVSYHSNPPANQDNLPTNVNRISNKEYWTLTRTAGSVMPKVSLYWMDRNYSGLEDLEVASVVLYTDNLWQRQGETSLDDVTPLAGHESDTLQGFITTRQSLSTSGDITFGFTYPTIVWKTDATSSAYAPKSNWIGKYAPSKTTNILVSGVATTYSPITNAEAHCYDMTIDDGGVLEIGANQIFTVHGNATITSTGTLKLGENSKILFMRDVNAPDANIVAENGSEVHISGETNQNIAISHCNNIVFEGGKDSKHKYTKTLDSDLQVDGSLNVTNFTILSVPNHTIGVKGDIVITSNGDFSGTSTITLNGDAKQLVNISPNRSLYNLEVNNTSETAPQVELGYTTKISNKLTLTKGIVKSTSSARLTMLGTSSSTPGNKTSFVTGPMEKQGSSDFVFPIGADTVVAQIGISGLGGNVAPIIAEYVHSKPTSVTAIDEPNLTNVSKMEYWRMFKNGSGSDPHITLYWNEKIHGITDPKLLRVAMFTGTRWISCGNAAFGGDSTGGFVKSSDAINLAEVTSSSSAVRKNAVKLTAAARTLASNNYTAITLASVDEEINPLPIELTAFTATVTPNNDVRIEWTTASETDNDYFTIEHIYNDEQDVVADVDAKGNAGANYSYLHVNQPAGTHYYRLLQTDFDGTSKVASDWITVTIENPTTNNLQLSATPNPGRLQDIHFDVTGFADGQLRYIVADMQGNTIIDQTIATEANYYRISAANWQLQPSVYLIKIFVDGKQATSKFVVE